MLTVFERVPELFVKLYDAQFQQWAREYRKRGNFAAIVFDLPPGMLAILGPDGDPVWRGCWLAAEVDRSRPQMPRVVIRPRTEHDAEMIERHVREMSPHWLN